MRPRARVRAAARPLLLLALGAGPALLPLGAPATAGAKPSGRSGLIAFDTSRQEGGAQSQTDCGGRSRPAVATMDGDGRHRRRLTEGVDPAVSPNGRLIAYVRCDGGNGDLMVMRRDGTRRRRVTDTPTVSETEPAFSADGRRLFFVRDAHGGGYGDIYSVKLGGGGLRRIVGHRPEQGDSSPHAAPNGRFLVFDRGDEVYTARPDGSRIRHLAEGWDPTISPNSRRVVFTHRGELHLIGAGGGRERTITDVAGKPGRLGAALAASFSPDGRWIAFALERNVDYGPGLASVQRLMKVKVAGGRTVALTTVRAGGFNPSWGP